jgi:DNA primase small subunit
MDNKFEVKNSEFLFRTYKQYYFKNIELLKTPKEIQSREFGIMNFDSRMIRHLSFSTIGKFKAYVIQNVPADIYCSNGYYQFPTFPVNDKGWKCADLIFDIDLKDLFLPCYEEHTFYICSGCNHIEKNDTRMCPHCKDTKIFNNTIPCNKCIKELKKETKNLIEFLRKDFGIKDENLEVSFSGNTGFHLLVFDEDYSSLDSKCRSDIVSYLMGKNLSLDSFGIRSVKDDHKIKIPLSGYSFGWRKRIAEKIKFTEISSDKLNKLIKKSGGYDSFKKEVNKIVLDIGVKIDPQVTTDIHRIFRMVGSLNSKSGLSKIICKNLEKFDLFKDSSFFSDDKYIEISINTSVKLIFKGKAYSLEEGITSVPLSLAVYLISKKIANVLNYTS